MALELPRRGDRENGLAYFSQELEKLSNSIGFKISARGWCYQLEGFGLITKAQFDRVENIINDCREKGYLAIDFTAEEEGRHFSGIEIPTSEPPYDFMVSLFNRCLHPEDMYTPDWWDGEHYYIQMVVEKIDLKTLFSTVCEEYHIPIATAKGWSSMRQRAEYARRFKEAEDRGLSCVLLYCGDHDPDGLRISDFLRNNLDELKNIFWEDGIEGYDPTSLEIERFGLNFDFIQQNNLSWINNLITGSKKDLGDPSHPNYNMPYLQDYIAKYGKRKCEANALVVNPAAAERLVRGTIELYLGQDARDRFKVKREAVDQEIEIIRSKTGLETKIQKALSEAKEQ